MLGELVGYLALGVEAEEGDRAGQGYEDHAAEAPADPAGQVEGAEQVHDVQEAVQGADDVHGGRVVAEVPAGGKTGWLTLKTTPGHEAGAALTGPIRATVGPGRMPLGDWETLGLSEYSGGVRYRRTVRLDERPDTGLMDLGRVRGTAEVLVNGRSCGIRVCSPYRFDVGPALRAGDNTVEVEVYGTLAPHLDAVSPTHFVFPGQRASGLYGPTRLLLG